MQRMDHILLEAKNIFKVYPNGVVANKNVNFTLVKGEIHALAGENGAGKSTLMKILFGMEQPSNGELLFHGKPVCFTSPMDAIQHGMGMVHQHFMLVSSFTVVQNIILGVEPGKGFSINYAEALRRAGDIARKYNFKIDLSKRVENISVGMKQKVEILKALYRDAKILILDEPTAVLTPQETSELFAQLRILKENGLTIVFISHKLNEVREICDRITIMRGGKTMGVFNVNDISEQEITRIMVGRNVSLKYDKPPQETSGPVLLVRDLVCKNETGKNLLGGVSFSIRGGEILGVAGVDGNGQSELAGVLAGEIPSAAGDITMLSSSVVRQSVRSIRSKGVAYIPEDRMSQGIAGDASISDNLIANRFNSPLTGNRFFLNSKKISRLSRSLIESFHITCAGADQKISMLSGGNMQKVVIARECSVAPKLLIANQPTRGVDIGSAEFIHQKLLRLRAEKTAILLISADLNEVIELSDRLIVFFEGNIFAYFENPSMIREEELGLAMLGLKKQSREEIMGAYIQ
jgi:simple sugar transport system ATP-binding protein